MLNPFKNFEKLDFRKFDDIAGSIISGNIDCYKYYEFDVVKNSEVFFELYLDGDISYEYYKEYENHLIEFILSLAKISKITAMVSLRGRICKNIPAKRSVEYYRKLKYMEKKYKKKLMLSQKEVEVTSIIGLREIGLVVYYFKELSMIMLIDSLKGYLLFENNKNVSKVLKIAKDNKLIIYSLEEIKLGG